MQILPCSILTVEMGAGSKVRWDGVPSFSDGPIEEKPRMGGDLGDVGGGRKSETSLQASTSKVFICLFIDMEMFLYSIYFLKE